MVLFGVGCVVGLLLGRVFVFPRPVASVGLPPLCFRSREYDWCLYGPCGFERLLFSWPAASSVLGIAPGAWEIDHVPVGSAPPCATRVRPDTAWCCG